MIPKRCDRLLMASLALCLVFPAGALARDPYVPSAANSAPAVSAEHGVVVAQEKIAAQIGGDILRQGGNAVDAAVATGFALAVTQPRAGNICGGGFMVGAPPGPGGIALAFSRNAPRAGNIGGGGFMVVHLAGREDIAIDYRETAPAAATPDMFLGSDGKPDNAKSRDSALGIGVPGTVAGLALALDKYGSGKFTLAQLLTPAIALARDGFAVSDDIADSLPEWHARLARWPAGATLFSRADGTALGEGDLVVQKDLAATLEAIAAQGPRGFYEGPVADKLAKAITAAGGLMTTDDL